MGYSTSVLSIHDQTKLIAEYGRRNLRFSWGMAEFGTLYRMGYKWCDRCTYLISIKKIINCPICGRRLRTKPKVKKK